MKAYSSYVGDSSDGEEQSEREDHYAKNKPNYIAHLNEGLLSTTHKYTYLFKDIGGRLTHDPSVTESYRKIKQSYQIKSNNKLLVITKDLKVKIQEADRILADKYILGKFISSSFNLKLEVAEEYFQENSSNICKLVNQDFPLLKEEEQFLFNLKEIYSQCNPEEKKELPIELLSNYTSFYQSIINNWDSPGEMALYFNIGWSKKSDGTMIRSYSGVGKFSRLLKGIITKNALETMLEAHQSNLQRADVVGDPNEQVKYFLKKLYKETIQNQGVK